MICTREQMPYEKFRQNGASSLTDAELLAIILRTGTQNETAVEIGMHILQKAGPEYGLLGLHHLSVHELTQIHGIGEVKAVKIKCIAELSTRIAQARTSDKVCFKSPETVAAYYMEQMRHLEKEHCIAVFLDNKNRLITDVCISIGTSNAALVSTRELFRQALRSNAVFLLLLHNHPSGDSSPSREDIVLTEKITEASKLMDIPLIDHIIIGDNNFVSLKNKGIIN